MIEVNRAKPFAFYPIKSNDLSKSNAIKRVSNTCKEAFNNLGNLLCNSFIVCANTLHLYKLTEEFSHEASQILGIALHGTSNLIRSYSESSINNFLALYFDKYLQTSSLFGNTIQKFVIEKIKEPYHSDVVFNRFLKLNTVLFFGSVTFLRFFKSFYPLEVFATSIETCLVAKNAIEGLSACWKLSRTRPSRAFKFAIIHVVDLASNMHRLHQSVRNQFYFPIEFEDNSSNDNYHVPKFNVPYNRDYYQNNSSRWKQFFRNKPLGCNAILKSDLNDLIKLPIEKRINTNLKKQCPQVSAAIITENYDLENLDIRQINRAFKKASRLLHPDKTGSNNNTGFQKLVNMRDNLNEYYK